MICGEPWMYHSGIAFYLNCGLLLLLKRVRAAEAAYRDGYTFERGEGLFIRQLIGWREYVRGFTG